MRPGPERGRRQFFRDTRRFRGRHARIATRFRALLALLVFASLEGILGAARGLRAAPGKVVRTTTRETGDRGGLSFGQAPDPRKVRRAFIAWEHTA